MTEKRGRKGLDPEKRKKRHNFSLSPGAFEGLESIRKALGYDSVSELLSDIGLGNLPVDGVMGESSAN